MFGITVAIQADDAAVNTGDAVHTVDNTNRIWAGAKNIAKSMAALALATAVLHVLNTAFIYLLGLVTRIFVPAAVRSAVFAAAPFTSTVVVPGMLVASAWASGIDSQPTRRNLAVLGGAGAALAFGVSNSSMPMFAAFLNAGSWSWAQMTSLVTSVGIVAGATAEVGIPAAIDFARSRNA